MARHPLSLIDAVSMLSAEQRAIVDTTREVLAEHVRPNLMDWYEAG